MSPEINTRLPVLESPMENMPFNISTDQDGGRCLILTPGFQLTSLDPGQALLIGYGKYFFLHDDAHIEAINKLDGNHTDIEIAEIVSCSRDPLDILVFLHELEQMGICTDAHSNGLAREALSFWNGQDYTPAELKKLYSNGVTIHSIHSGLSKELIQKAVQRAGIQESSLSPALQIVVTHDLFDPKLDEIATQNYINKLPWLIAYPVGQFPLLSPLFIFDDGPCWTCLKYWLRVNQPVEEYIRRVKGAAALSPIQEVQPTVRLFAELAVTTVGHTILKSNNKNDHLLVLDVKTRALKHHLVKRRPQCAICGNPEFMKEQAYQPVKLNNVTKISILTKITITTSCMP